MSMDTGAAGHTRPETLFPTVKIEYAGVLQKFVAANTEDQEHGAFKTSEAFTGAPNSGARTP